MNPCRGMCLYVCHVNEIIFALICNWVMGIQSHLAQADVNWIDFSIGWRKVSRNNDFRNLEWYFGMALGLI